MERITIKKIAPRVRIITPRTQLEKPPAPERILEISLLGEKEDLLFPSWEQAQSSMLRRAMKLNKQGYLSNFERACIIDSLEETHPPQQHRQYFGWGGVWGIAGQGWYFSITPVAKEQFNAR